MHMLFCILIIAHTIVSAQHIVNNPCQSRPIQENFDLVKYTTNSWYEIARYDVPFEKGCNCGFADYILNANNTVKVRNCCKRENSTTLHCTIGQAKPSEPDHIPLEGKLNVAFGNRSNTISNYWILSTDYENYSIVYFCRNLTENKSSDLAWVLAREPELNTDVKTTVDALINQYFDSNAMYQGDQSAERCEPRDQ